MYVIGVCSALVLICALSKMSTGFQHVGEHRLFIAILRSLSISLVPFIKVFAQQTLRIEYIFRLILIVGDATVLGKAHGGPQNDSAIRTLLLTLFSMDNILHLNSIATRNPNEKLPKKWFAIFGFSGSHYYQMSCWF